MKTLQLIFCRFANTEHRNSLKGYSLCPQNREETWRLTAGVTSLNMVAKPAQAGSLSLKGLGVFFDKRVFVTQTAI
jgi:hypothetical protein